MVEIETYKSTWSREVGLHNLLNTEYMWDTCQDDDYRYSTNRRAYSIHAYM